MHLLRKISLKIKYICLHNKYGRILAIFTVILTIFNFSLFNLIPVKNVFAINSFKNIKIGLSLGLSNTTGTIPSISLNTRNYIKYIDKKSKWRHVFRFNYTYIEAYSELSYLRLVLQEYSKYKFNNWLYFFGKERYDRNISTGFEYVINENIGAGVKYKISDNSNIFLELGPGLRQEKIIDGQYYGSFSSIFDAKYYYKINKNLKFKEKLTAYIANKGGDSYNSFSELSTRIERNLYLVLEYEIDYQTITTYGFKPFNTISSANIKVKF